MLLVSSSTLENSNLAGRSNLVAALRAYCQRFPAEQACCDRFISFVESEPRCYERNCWRGHVTGSAWLVNGAGSHVLLTHHRKLGLWLQLGGHSDGDPDTASVALREVYEESGLEVQLLQTSVFDVDIHGIPARKQDPAHNHFDVRFLVEVVGSEQFVVSPESIDLRWVSLDRFEEVTKEPSMLRMRKKCLIRNGSV